MVALLAQQLPIKLVRWIWLRIRVVRLTNSSSHRRVLAKSLDASLEGPQCTPARVAYNQCAARPASPVARFL